MTQTGKEAFYPDDGTMGPAPEIKSEEDPVDGFRELLSVMDSELLIRFRQKLDRVGRKRMVKILTSEIEKKEKEELAKDSQRIAKLKDARQKER